MRLPVVLVLLSVWGCHGMMEQIQLPELMGDCFRRHSDKTTVVETVGESIASFCIDQYLWRASRDNGWRPFNISREAFEWAHGLLKKTGLKRHKRQAFASRMRIRKEYRRLTEEERNNFHTAVQLLKADTSVLPNRYDALSAIHQGIVTTSAHGGPNFLGFHRVYLLMFENALREKIPLATLPYWDSTLDEGMMDPTQSVLFTPAFMGNGFGIVTSGPFSHWHTLSGPLIRNIGQSGQLFRRVDMQRIASSVRLAQITEPNAAINSSLEFLHNQIHLWIDGQMGSLNTAAHDPIFWVHHAYVDYVWELFRRNQRAMGINPERDYPGFVNNSMHLPASAMGLSDFRNMDGLSDRFTRMMYTYEPSPGCSQAFPDCGSPYLQCVVRNFQPTCVSRDRFSAPGFFPVNNNIRSQQMAIVSAARTRQMQEQAVASARIQSQMIVQQQIQRQQIQQQQQIQQRFQQQQLQQRQQQMLTSIQQQNVQQKEIENAGLDDASEIHQVQRRFARQANNAVYNVLNQKGHAMPFKSSTFIAPKMFNMQHGNQVNILPNSSAAPLQNYATSCPTIPQSQGYQNTYNINGRSDINEWVYLPVKVIYQRPPKFTYTSYPVVNGEAEEGSDVYSSIAPSIRTMLNNGTPAAYPKCGQQEQSISGKVFVSSQGLNYMGKYREYAIVDHRLAISVSTTYVAIKSPETQASKVYLYAYDSCGRICQPYCRLPNSSQFQRCTGAFLFTNRSPKLYGTNYGNAVSNFWHFSQTGGSPTMMDSNIHVQFHCNFQESWPFPSTVPPKSGEEHEEPEVEQKHRSRPVSTQMSSCHVGYGCIVRGACMQCQQNRLYACLGACALYTSCKGDVHYVHQCPEGTWFDQDENKCRPGVCVASRNQWWFSTSTKRDLR